MKIKWITLMKMNYNILGKAYKKFSHKNLHTNPVFGANPRPGGA